MRHVAPDNSLARTSVPVSMEVETPYRPSKAAPRRGIRPVRPMPDKAGKRSRRFLNVDAMRSVYEFSKAGGSEKFLLVTIASYVNRSTRTAFPSIETLARDTGLHRSTVMKKLKALEELAEVQVERVSNRSNRYRIVLPGSPPVPTSRPVPTSTPVSTDRGRGVPTSMVSPSRPEERTKKELNKEGETAPATASRLKKENRTGDNPTLEEVKQFAVHNQLRSDPLRFFYHYDALGWKNIINWRAKLQEWELRESDFGPARAKPAPAGGISRPGESAQQLQKAIDTEQERLRNIHGTL